MSSSSHDPLLLTPGPLTTSPRTRQAMLRDRGSREAEFIDITRQLCEKLLQLVHGEASHVCVPLQGSGTFAVEAAFGTLMPPDGHVLVPVNGAYCDRIAKICRHLGRRVSRHDYAEDQPMQPADIDRLLAADPSITHVAVVHCETTTGILNPLPDLAAVVQRHGRRLLVDAMSSFGAIHIDARETPFDAVIAASGKCLEGPPGMGFVIARRTALEQARGNCHSVVLDLYEQWHYLEQTGQWRFTPPTHVAAALLEAIRQLEEEGGVAARHARYRRNCDELLAAMRALGLRSFLPPERQAPVIVTFHSPADPAFGFDAFYQAVKQRGFVLYPGKLTKTDTFRIGCIGHLGPHGMAAAAAAITDALRELGVNPAR